MARKPGLAFLLMAVPACVGWSQAQVSSDRVEFFRKLVALD